MKTPNPDTLEMLQTLKSAVAKTLDRKRRLGQYAVSWEDGKVAFTEGDYPMQHSSIKDQSQVVGEDISEYSKRP